MQYYSVVFRVNKCLLLVRSPAARYTSGMKSIIHFFDKLEDYVRIYLSHYPIAYAFVGGIGVALMWSGVEETASFFPILYGPGSFILGSAMLLVSGLLVSFFIGDSIILSGLKREKKLAEKTEIEIKTEKDKMDLILDGLKQLQQDVAELKAQHVAK